MSAKLLLHNHYSNRCLAHYDNIFFATPSLADFVADILIADDNAAGSAVRDQLIKLMTHLVHINKISFTHYFC